MTSSKKRLIEHYVNLRCKKLQEASMGNFDPNQLDEQWYNDAANWLGSKAKSAANTALDYAVPDFIATPDQVKGAIKTTAGKVAQARDKVNQVAGDVASKGWDVAKKAGGKALDVAKAVGDSKLGYLVPGMAGAQAAYSMYNAKDKHGNWTPGAAVNSVLDDVQTGLDVAGMIPAVGAIPDLVNVGISGARGGVAQAMGDQEAANKHYLGAGLSAAAAVPVVGLAAGAGKLGKTGLKMTNKFGQALDKASAPVQKFAANTKVGQATQKGLETVKYGNPKIFGGQAFTKKVGAGVPYLATKAAVKADKKFNDAKGIKAVASAPGKAVDQIKTNIKRSPKFWPTMGV
tara:strand:- start:184 stop:1218 length:1035 start_codon:yes stop_codon:yes gene_type:complete